MASQGSAADNKRRAILQTIVAASKRASRSKFAHQVEQFHGKINVIFCFRLVRRFGSMVPHNRCLWDK